MKQPAKPLLTVGLIVKNEIRCIERCLKSLEPLRKAIPCQVIVADTGSDDGTREVAEKYADLVFDFAWIGSFAAARNAVLDKARGEWFLTMDADEWLDGDFRELTEFLSYPILRQRFNLCGVTIYNYTTENFENGLYGEFLALRLFKLSSGVRYEGIVHESPKVPNPSYYAMSHLVLHHDGYVDFGGEKSKNKRERNMELLRKKLADDPKDLMTLLQCIESSDDTATFDYLRQALQGVREEWPAWDVLGPSIYRHAATLYRKHDMPEFWDTVREAEKKFPQAMMVRIEINYLAVEVSMKEKNYEEAVRRCEAYLQAVEDYHNKRYDQSELTHMVITAASPFFQREICVKLANAYYEVKDYDAALSVVRTLQAGRLENAQLESLLCILFNLQTHSRFDLSNVVSAFWEQISAPDPDKKRADERILMVSQVAQRAFSWKFRKQEEEKSLARHAYTLFLPLKDRCALGIAAAIIETEDAEDLDRLLSAVEDWGLLPIHALAHAISAGAAFPLPGDSLPMEVLDELAVRLTAVEDDFLRKLCLCMDIPEDFDDLNWARGLMLAAVQACKWENPEKDFPLVRRFVQLEAAYLPRCYTQELLSSQLPLLPPVHRFGAYLIRAFEALDAGDKTGYVRRVREGLTACESMKPMAKFLMEEAKKPADGASEELSALAAQVKRMLAAFPEGDPRLEQLRKSDIYQQVAGMIE